jgi:hypothetical protein
MAPTSPTTLIYPFSHVRWVGEATLHRPQLAKYVKQDKPVSRVLFLAKYVKLGNFQI